MPACFLNTAQHGEWLALARTSKEVCSICTAAYETEMVLQGRCDRESWELMEMNKRENAGDTRRDASGAGRVPGRSVELGERLAGIRQRAGEVARAFLSANKAGFQTGGEL